LTLFVEWERFRKVCLKGRSKEDVAGIRDIFYAGALATGALLSDISKSDLTPEQQNLEVARVYREMTQWQAQAKARAAKEMLEGK
jgi:hypothetical protein